MGHKNGLSRCLGPLALGLMLMGCHTHSGTGHSSTQDTVSDSTRAFTDDDHIRPVLSSGAALLPKFNRPTGTHPLTIQVIEAKPQYLAQARTFYLTPKVHGRPIKGFESQLKQMADALRRKGLIELQDNARADLLVIYDAALRPTTANNNAASLQLVMLQSIRGETGPILYRAVSRTELKADEINSVLNQWANEMLLGFPNVLLGRRQAKLITTDPL